MIPIGVLVPLDDAEAAVGAYVEAGFESVSFFVWEKSSLSDVRGALERACAVAAEAGLMVSCLSVYGNPLRNDETGESIRSLWRQFIGHAATLAVPLVTGFAGRVPGASVEDSLPAWRELFAPLADRASAKGLRLAFENCRIGDTWKTGKWNIAINPDAWELMFEALDAPNLGLEWEPSHQLESFADPYLQLETWAKRVFHVHGKDSKIDSGALAARGAYSQQKWHRSVLPGQGDSDWARLTAILARSGYSGTIDLEHPEAVSVSSDLRIKEEGNSLSYMKKVRN